MKKKLKKVLFLDRDGVINEDNGYVHKKADFKFIPGIFDVCRFFIARGYGIIVVSNQSGIARGFFTEEMLAQLDKYMKAKFKIEGVDILKSYYCPYHPVKGIGVYQKNSEYRKPKPGMLLKAKEEFGIDMEKSVLIGDKGSDITAGNKAGIGIRILLKSRYAQNAPEADYTVDNLKEVIEIIKHAT